MSSGLVWVILFPLVGAASCWLVGARHERWPAALATTATVAAACVVAWKVATVGMIRHRAGGWGPPLGIDLRADGLAAVMLLGVGIVGALLTIEALRTQGQRGFIALWLLAWAALDALILSADAFNLYVTLELTMLASVALIAIEGRRDALRAALRYLLFALPGSLLYLLGVAFLYGTHATLDLTTLGPRLVNDATTWAALTLMTLGLCLKAALFPLHAWLPPAYVTAPSTVAAFLSALVGKGPFYVLLRLWLELVPGELELLLGLLLGTLGAGGVLWGSLLALRQNRLRPIIAYSSVAQIGYLFLLFPVASQSAVMGGIYLAISHAAAAAAMFVAVGAIERALGHDELAGLQGLVHKLPVTCFALALAGLGLMGLPPSGGFVAKWLLLNAAFASGHWILAAVILLGGLLAAAYVFRFLREAFSPAPVAAIVRAPPTHAELLALVLALLSVLLGLLAHLPLVLMSKGWPS